MKGGQENWRQENWRQKNSGRKDFLIPSSSHFSASNLPVHNFMVHIAPNEGGQKNWDRETF
jgi:hypothetical protein